MIKTEIAEQRPAASAAFVTRDRLLWASFAIFLACYVGRCIWAAINTPLWLDEVLSIWVIRMGSAKEIFSAIAHGSEFVPPTYNLFLHYYSLVAGDSYLALRVPSIAACLAFTLCSFVLLKRYLGLAAAMFGSWMILEEIRFYALQIRPYAFCVACFAWALVLWDDLNRTNSRWRYVVIAMLLALATSIHFYSVFFIPCLGVVELLRLIQTRQFRLPLWIAMFLAGASAFLWLPMIHVMSKYNSGDTGSPSYYATPSVTRLLYSYYDFLCEDRVIPIIILAAAALIAISKFGGKRLSDEENQTRDSNFWPIALGVSMLPVIIYVFSVVVTKTYNDRYILAVSFGISALITGVFSRTPAFRRSVPLLLLIAAYMTYTHGTFAWGTFERAPVFQELQRNIPIVIADAQQLFTLEESSPENIRSRIVYLALPPYVPLPDSTVVHQLLRWKAINPKLPVEDVSEFLKSHDDFYVLDTHAGTDDTPLQYIAQRRPIYLKRKFADGVELFESRPAGPEVTQ